MAEALHLRVLCEKILEDFSHLYNLHAPCAIETRAPLRPVRACFVQTCCAVVVSDHDPRTMLLQGNT